MLYLMLCAPMSERVMAAAANPGGQIREPACHDTSQALEAAILEDSVDLQSERPLEPALIFLLISSHHLKAKASGGCAELRIVGQQ